MKHISILFFYVHECLVMDKKFEEFVNVSVRIRPSLFEDTSPCLQVINKHPPVLLVPDKSQTYHFDHVFTDTDTQKDIYDETVKSLVEHVKSGYNCTVFAYGQTGTGKTYTMGTSPDISYEKECGLVPRTLEDFFSCSDDNAEIELSVSFIEIYNEKVFDLLTDKKIPLSVKGFTVHGFEKIQVYSVYNALQLLKTGSKHRHTGETKQNSNSSRSHAVFTIYCNARDSQRETVAKLNLVDLAGSESVRKTGNQGNSLHEGININKGLLSLGQVMTALSTNSTHIPYRQSIITTILQDSLNKKNFVSLIACVSPGSEDLGETLQTLEFSQRVKKMKNKPEVNNFITQYKKDNPSLFLRGLTPSKRSSGSVYETPFKKPQRYLPVIQEPLNLINNSDCDSPKSILSSTMSSASDTQQNLSPVIKKYMNAMEHSLMNKLEDVIKNTLKKSRRTSSRLQNKENSMTPSFSWDQLAKVVRSEVQLQFSTKVSRATSSPLENNILFENSDQSIAEPTPVRKVLSFDNFNPDSAESKECETDYNVIFKVPVTPKTKYLERTVRRSSMRLQNKKNKQQIQPENRRRSVRLQLKQTTEPNFEACQKLAENESICLCSQSLRSSKKKKKEVAEPKGSPISARMKRVLKILNNGSLKEIETLHTVGSKTAEKIQFFRQLKGSFKSVADLSEMPYWTKKKYEKFLAENFLRIE